MLCSLYFFWVEGGKFRVKHPYSHILKGELQALVNVVMKVWVHKR
jgi:hypothetical protein